MELSDLYFILEYKITGIILSGNCLVPEISNISQSMAFCDGIVLLFEVWVMLLIMGLPIHGTWRVHWQDLVKHCTNHVVRVRGDAAESITCCILSLCTR